MKLRTSQVVILSCEESRKKLALGSIWESEHEAASIPMGVIIQQRRKT